MLASRSVDHHSNFLIGNGPRSDDVEIIVGKTNVITVMLVCSVRTGRKKVKLLTRADTYSFSGHNRRNGRFSGKCLSHCSTNRLLDFNFSASKISFLVTVVQTVEKAERESYK